jgi:hypothetical protein
VSGERDLARLLETLAPVRRPGRYVYACVDAMPDGIEPFAVVREDEGLTLVLDGDDADRLGLATSFDAALITLRVHSALEAVGLTAAIARALAAESISANVIAGFHHDHVLVPLDRADDALACLQSLSAEPR